MQHATLSATYFKVSLLSLLQDRNIETEISANLPYLISVKSVESSIYGLMYTRLYGGINENWTSPTILMEVSQSKLTKAVKRFMEYMKKPIYFGLIWLQIRVARRSLVVFYIEFNNI
jgi:hypothetical protein